jgi:hypothetical protein
MSRLEEELATVANLWTAWQRGGITKNTVLAVQVFFYADREDTAQHIAETLRGWGLRDVKIESTRLVIFFKGWNITGIEEGTWSLEKLQDRSRRYVSLAEKWSARYEGCNTATTSADDDTET